MGLLTGIFAEAIEAERSRQAEARSSLENPQTPLSYPAEWLLDLFNGGRTEAGIRVSEMTAFQVITFLTCVDLISGSIAGLPLHVYERNFLPSGRAMNKVAYDHDLYDTLHGEPNDEMTRFTFLKAYISHTLAWGNGYAELQRDAGNSVLGLWPRNPAKTRPYRLSSAMTLEPVAWRPFPVTLKAGELVYKTSDALDDQDRTDADATSARTERIIPAADMLHVSGLSLDGRVGQSVVWLSRQTLGLALATEKYGSKYFANYAKPGGILEVPVGMTQAQRDAAKQSWMEAQGGENAHRTAVLPAGFKWTGTSSNPEEAQAIETRHALRNDICAIFHVPPHMVGDVDKSRANTEQMAQEFVSYALTPWLSAMKQEFKRKLFPNPNIGRSPKNRFFVDFDVHDLIRPDAASREKFYATGRQWAFLNTNDILVMEKLNPVDQPWAEKYWMPINMTLTDTPLDPTHQDGSGNGDQPAGADAGAAGGKKDGKGASDPKANGDTADGDNKRHLSTFRRVFRDSLSRILTRNRPVNRDFIQAFGPVLWSLADLFAREARGETSADTDRFIAEYLGAMEKRRASWQNDDNCSDQELARAVRAIRVAVYRDVATQHALEESRKQLLQ